MTVGRAGLRGWRGLWDERRARLWLTAAIAAAWLPVLGVPLRGFLDFSAFYAAGSLAFRPEVTSIDAIVTFQADRGLPITPFVYPAGVALAYVPFAALPYGLAGALNVLVMAALLLLALRLGADLLGLPHRVALLGGLAWAPAAAGVASGQNSSLALLLVVLAAAALVRGRARLAGTLAGVLLYKPQLGAPIVGTLFVRGLVWGVFVAALVGLGHYALGVVATGGELAWPADWLATVRDPRYADGDLRANGWQAVSFPALLARTRFLGPGAPDLAGLGYALGGVVVLASLPALRRWPVESAVALACAAGIVISPHAWVYDATLLLPAMGVLTRDAGGRGWPWQDRWLLAAGYGLALLWPLGGLIGVTPVAPVVWLAPLVMLGVGPLRRFAIGHAGTLGAQAGTAGAPPV